MTPSRGSASPRTLLAIVCAAQLLLIFDATAVSVAVVPIGRALQMEATSLAWVINAYTLAFGGLLLAGGRLADTVGRRLTFAGGLALFATASAIAAVAQTPAALMAARCAQGAAAALVAPAILGLLAVAFPDHTDRVRAVALVGVVTALGGSAGVLGGGVVSEFASWRWIFVTNAVLSLLVCLLGVSSVPRLARGGVTERLSLIPILLATAVAATTIQGLQGLGAPGVLAWLVPTVLLAGFLVAERRAPRPMFPWGQVGTRTRTVAVGIVAVTSMVSSGMFFTLTLTLQNDRHWGAAQTGAVFVPFGVALFLGSWAGPAILRVVSERAVVRICSTLTTAGLLALAAAQHGGGWPAVVPGLACVAFGSAVMTVALTTLALHGATDASASGAGAMVSVAQQIGGAFGVALASLAVGAMSAQHILLAITAVTVTTAVALAFAVPSHAQAIGYRHPLRAAAS